MKWNQNCLFLVFFDKEKLFTIDFQSELVIKKKFISRVFSESLEKKGVFHPIMVKRCVTYKAKMSKLNH